MWKEDGLGSLRDPDENPIIYYLFDFRQPFDFIEPSYFYLEVNVFAEKLC